MSKLVLAAATLAAMTLAGAHGARAQSGYKITVNGPSLTGIALDSLEAHRPIVAAVILPGDAGLPGGTTLRDPDPRSGLVVAAGGGTSDTNGGDARPPTPDANPK